MFLTVPSSVSNRITRGKGADSEDMIRSVYEENRHTEEGGEAT